MRETLRSHRAFLRDLKAKCEYIESEIRFKELATNEELDSYRPGGDENPDRDQGAWVFWYATLIRYVGRLELKESQRERATEGGERTILDALTDKPVTVELQPIGDEPSRRVSVYPKSFEALAFVDSRERNIRWLSEQNQKLLPLPANLTVETITAVDRETIHQYGLIVHAVTHAGAGLPFPAEDPPAALPAWITDLSPINIIDIHNAHIECNVFRIHALYLLLEITTGETQPARRLSWATFFSARAEEIGIETRSLMRDRSLTSQIASALIAAEARKRLLDESKKGEAA
jgi:hypothetical protein